MLIIHGYSINGVVDRVPGLFYVATQFRHRHGQVDKPVLQPRGARARGFQPVSNTVEDAAYAMPRCRMV